MHALVRHRTLCSNVNSEEFRVIFVNFRVISPEHPDLGYSYAWLTWKRASILSCLIFINSDKDICRCQINTMNSFTKKCFHGASSPPPFFPNSEARDNR